MEIIIATIGYMFLSVCFAVIIWSLLHMRALNKAIKINDELLLVLRLEGLSPETKQDKLSDILVDIQTYKWIVELESKEFLVEQTIDLMNIIDKDDEIKNN